VRATGKVVVLHGLIAREILGMGVVLLCSTVGIATKEYFGEGDKAFTPDSFVAEKCRLDVVF
jgi:hypothetical protein